MTSSEFNKLSPAQRQVVLDKIAAKKAAQQAAPATTIDRKEIARKEIAEAVCAEQAFRAELYKNFTPQGSDTPMTAEEYAAHQGGVRKLEEMERHSQTLINIFKNSYPNG